MICPICSNNQKHSEGMTCRKCQYKFVLDPKIDKTNDHKFSKALQTITANYSIHFTFNQFYAEFCRFNEFKKLNQLGRSFFFMIITGVSSHLFFDSTTITIAVALVTLVGSYIITWSTHKRPEYAHVEKLFLKWCEKNKQAPKGLLIKPSLHSPPPSPIDNDIYDYGVEAIIIVNKDIYVDLFVLNDMHTDLKALVMSKTGYPNYLMPISKNLLENNSETPIYVIHDAADGEGMINEVKETFDIQDREVVDLGLFPNDFQEVKRLKGLKQVPNQPLDVLSKNEIVNLLSISIRDQIPIAASAALIYPHDESSYGSFG